VKRLVIDTATRACSVALFEDGACIAAFHEEIGRGHAERLVPMISELPDKGRAAAIHVNVGPGSFTGIRVGISAARALALAWKAECHGYGCLDFIAAIARVQVGAVPVDVVMTGGHGEYFFQPFDATGVATVELRSLPPETAASQSNANIIAGDIADKLATVRSGGQAINLVPDARHWPMISDNAAVPPSPRYGRGADAKLPGGITP
jgi:tRNA threonylcarbamoyl adenosine modification protein YeaZ